MIDLVPPAPIHLCDHAVLDDVVANSTKALAVLQDYSAKTRHVRDSAFWGAPVGTPLPLPKGSKVNLPKLRKATGKKSIIGLDEVDDPDIHQLAVDVATFDWGGFRTTLDVGNSSVGEDGVVWIVANIHKDGKSAGYFIRGFDYGKKTLMNETLALHGPYQGQGFAEHIYQHVEDIAANEGMTQVHIQANNDVGGYAWARRRFDWERKDDAKRITERIRMVADAAPGSVVKLGSTRFVVTERLKAQAARMIDGGRTPSPYEITTLGERMTSTHVRKTTHAGIPVTLWPGKSIMLGQNWYGIKPIGVGLWMKDAHTDWMTLVRETLPYAESVYVADDYFDTHDGSITDYNVLSADLLARPQIETKSVAGPWDSIAATLADLQSIMESKTRHVRDADYWGAPVGTPIEPGMKPGAGMPSLTATQEAFPGMEAAGPRQYRKVPIMRHGSDDIDGEEIAHLELDLSKPLVVPAAFTPHAVKLKPYNPDAKSEPLKQYHEFEETEEAKAFALMIARGATVAYSSDAQMKSSRLKAMVNDQISERIYDHMHADPELHAWVDQKLQEKYKSDVGIDRAYSMLGGEGLVKLLGLESTVITDIDQIRAAVKSDPDKARKTLWRYSALATIFMGLGGADGEVGPDYIVDHWGEFDAHSDEELLIRGATRERIDKWAATSGDTDADATALQIVASDVFGLGEVTETDHLDMMLGRSRAENMYPFLKAFLLANYWQTQELLTDMNVTSIPAYRGMKWEYSEYNTSIPDWATTTTQDVALQGFPDRAKVIEEEMRAAKIDDYITTKVDNAIEDDFQSDRWEGLIDEWVATLPVEEGMYVYSDTPGVTTLWDAAHIRLKYRRWRENNDKRQMLEAMNQWGDIYTFSAEGEGHRNFGDWLSDNDYGIEEEARWQAWRDTLDEMSNVGPDFVTMTAQPLSSWSTSIDVAGSFTSPDEEDSVYSLVIKSEVPRSRIISMTVTGIGCLAESELIVLGGEDKVDVA